MTPSKITIPLLLGIAGTIGFNLSPIVLGFGMTMIVCFLVYAGIMLFLSFADRRVLGYATVLSACNPANSLANLSFSFLLAILTIIKGSPAVGRVVWELGKHRWWWLYLSAFILIGLSVPFWPSDLRETITEVKQALSRLGYLVAFPLAVGLTIRTSRDGVRAVSLLCLISVVLFAVFYFKGQAGKEVIAAVVKGGEPISVVQHIGNIYMNFSRTQVCIPMAALAAVSLALGIGLGLNLRALPFYMASGICVFMITLLASVGSAFAMVCGMVVVALVYFRDRLFQGRIVLGVILFSIVGSALYWSVFQTENMLSERIKFKTAQIETSGIDRQEFWVDGISEICNEPFGEGWTTRTGHSDWLLFSLSYGWPTGLLYIAASGSLLLSSWRALRRRRDAADRQSRMLLMVGLAALTVYLINAILDMLSANIGYYQIVWALILTPAAVMAVSDASKRTTKSSVSSPLSLNQQCCRS